MGTISENMQTLHLNIAALTGRNAFFKGISPFYTLRLQKNKATAYFNK
jgi:hypothetical protein